MHVERIQHHALAIGGARTQGRADQALTLHQHATQIQLIHAPAHQADQHHAAVLLQHLLIVGQIAAAHRVENHVGAAPVVHGLDEAAIVAVPAGIRAEAQAGLQLFLAADGHEARMPEQPAQLDGGGTDAAGTGVQQYALLVLEIALDEQVQPGGGEHLRQGGGVSQAIALRHRQHLQGVDDHLLGIAATGQQRTDRITDLEALDVAANFTNGATDLQSQDLTGTFGGRILPGTLHQVGAVDAGPGHLDTHLIRGDPVRGLGFLPDQ